MKPLEFVNKFKCANFIGCFSLLARGIETFWRIFGKDCILSANRIRGQFILKQTQEIICANAHLLRMLVPINFPHQNVAVCSRIAVEGVLTTEETYRGTDNSLICAKQIC